MYTIGGGICDVVVIIQLMCYLDNGKRFWFNFWNEKIVLPKMLKESCLGFLESIYGIVDLNSQIYFYFKVNARSALDNLWQFPTEQFCSLQKLTSVCV